MRTLLRGGLVFLATYAAIYSRFYLLYIYDARDYRLGIGDVYVKELHWTASRSDLILGVSWSQFILDDRGNPVRLFRPSVYSYNTQLTHGGSSGPASTDDLSVKDQWLYMQVEMFYLTYV